jgi:hypothetical protein
MMRVKSSNFKRECAETGRMAAHRADGDEGDEARAQRITAAMASAA